MSKACILIVDDDLTNRLILSSLLKESGFEFIEASDGIEAVELIDNNKNIDIVLLDIMMPVMDGYEAARRIKQKAGTFVPIIFLTAMTDEKALTKCIEVGGDDFLTKPYNHAILHAKISSLLRIKHLYKQVEQQNIELSRHNARVRQEVDVARKVFDSILDHNMDRGITGLRYSMSPMSIFNGDMILAERNQTNGLDVLISDFTGHGLSAAIGSIPVSDVFYSMTRKGHSHSEILAQANDKLLRLLPTSMFMAAVLISIDRANDIVTVINCGLPDLYLVRDGKIIRIFKSSNIPLGIEKASVSDYSKEMTVIEYGDRIISGTDGIIELRDENGAMYGRQGLVDSIETAPYPDRMFDYVLERCKKFKGGKEQSDDITLLEICHLEDVQYFDDESVSSFFEPAQWSMQFELDIQSLRHFDLMPYVMQGVNGLQSIPNSRSTIYTVLSELISNAIDHGLLNLDSSMKDSPAGYMQYYHERNRRLDAYDEGSIQVMLSHELRSGGGGRLVIHVVDSGQGFDYSRAGTELDANSGYAGRGMALISRLCKEVRYLGKGNAVMAIYEWD